jgi:hypothetical protein
VQKRVGLRPLEYPRSLTETSSMSDAKRPHGSRFRDALVIINPGAIPDHPAGCAADRPIRQLRCVLECPSASNKRRTVWSNLSA